MLNDKLFYPTLPASDLDRARQFYEKKLGFELVDGGVVPDGVFYEVGDHALFLYKTEAPRGGNTALSFVVDDLETEMRELRDRGIEFEEYDLPGLKTENGIAEWDGMRAAWFKDSEGNILNLEQPSEQQLHMIDERRARAGSLR